MPPPSNISTSHIIQLMKWHVPDAVRVDKFFKQVPLSGWDFDGFCAFHQADSKNVGQLFKQYQCSLNLLLDPDQNIPEDVKTFTVLQQRKDLQDALDGAIAAGTKAFETLGLVTVEEHQRQQQEQQQMQTKDQLEEQLARTLNELVETQQQLWQVQVGLIREQEGHLETQGRLQQIQKDIIQMQETYIKKQVSYEERMHQMIQTLESIKLRYSQSEVRFKHTEDQL
ncbi:hypothetical protein BGX29_009015 [Mortierella sp. GBA35]|nr:hypothetical protein BGX29_009015 [Mortierella sp. GBA35]